MMGLLGNMGEAMNKMAEFQVMFERLVSAVEKQNRDIQDIKSLLEKQQADANQTNRLEQVSLAQQSNGSAY